MTTYVALLRGINLGSRNKIAMAELRALLTDLGHGNVQTHILSGNAIFTSRRRSAPRVADEIAAEIQKRFGFDIAVLVRTREELAAVVENNPWPAATSQPSRFFAIFLSADPAPDKLRAIDPAAYAPDKFRMGHRVIYAWYPHGLQSSKLMGALSDKRLGVTATTRNWNTTTKLLELAGD